MCAFVSFCIWWNVHYFALFFLSPLLALSLLVSRVIRHGAVVRFALLYRMTIFDICWISFLVVGNSRCQKCIWTSCLSFNNETLLTIYRTKEREEKKPSRIITRARSTAAAAMMMIIIVIMMINRLSSGILLFGSNLTAKFFFCLLV